MTVKEFVLSAFEPKKIEVYILQESYDMIGKETGKPDNVLLDVFGDYIVNDFKSLKPDEYVVWVKAVPVKKEALA